MGREGQNAPLPASASISLSTQYILMFILTEINTYFTAEEQDMKATWMQEREKF